MPSLFKSYLGDGVYADWDGYHVVITTEDGIGGPTNEIKFEGEVIRAFVEYVERLEAKLQNIKESK